MMLGTAPTTMCVEGDKHVSAVACLVMVVAESFFMKLAWSNRVHHKDSEPYLPAKKDAKNYRRIISKECW
ncbi:unnamed protein product [Sphenostylis stenocarpa]|uniref:Uncharacterized protein n=1 Tax=Sphenostylis stenocarpa TaxID=92480 RepID=A0AA86VG95_9FABA|nr:unnamed protein product [Sphenostylis stenocarpa]